MAYNPQEAKLPSKTPKILRKGARVPAAAFPASPIEGDTFWRTSDKTYWIWNGAAWKQITVAP